MSGRCGGLYLGNYEASFTWRLGEETNNQVEIQRQERLRIYLLKGIQKPFLGVCDILKFLNIAF